MLKMPLSVFFVGSSLAFGNKTELSKSCEHTLRSFRAMLTQRFIFLLQTFFGNHCFSHAHDTANYRKDFFFFPLYTCIHTRILDIRCAYRSDEYVQKFFERIWICPIISILFGEKRSQILPIQASFWSYSFEPNFRSLRRIRRVVTTLKVTTIHSFRLALSLCKYWKYSLDEANAYSCY